MQKITIFLFGFLAIAAPVMASTTVTVDDSSSVTVHPNASTTVQATPVLVARADSGAFEGQIERINKAANQIHVIDEDGRTRIVQVSPEAVDSFKTGDFVHVQPVTGRDEMLVQKQDKRDLEGRIINVDSSKGQIIVRDAEGRERKVILKEGMINQYKVDDFVQIHLMADMKEAKTIRTVYR